MASASPSRMPGRTPFASAVAVTDPSSGSVPGSGASAAGATSSPGRSRRAARRSKAGMTIAAITGNVCSTRTDVRRQLVRREPLLAPLAEDEADGSTRTSATRRRTRTGSMTSVRGGPSSRNGGVDIDVEQPFHTDLEYYEGRADGIATTSGIGVDEARDELARRHGLAGWDELAAYVAGMASGEIPPTPFVLAYRAVEDGDRARLEALLDEHPGLVRQ